MIKNFRSGILGALMDEYERALSEFAEFVSAIPTPEYSRIVDSQTADKDCQSVQSIVSHVINSGYNYADYIRNEFSIPADRPPRKIIDIQDMPYKIRSMIQYTLSTLEDRWSLSENELYSFVFRTRWGVDYNLEQILEHAIVHVLRHRRQINKFIHRGDIKMTV